MTKFIKKKEISSDWYEIDAKNAIVGRLAVIISKIIRGKNKKTFSPNMDDGDFVVVKNIEKIKFTGQKFKKKKYFRHTGHPGGIKEITPNIMMAKKPQEILKLAVKRMLPGGPLSKKQLKHKKGCFLIKNHIEQQESMFFINKKNIGKQEGLFF